jgi:hypothetical protein
MLYMRLRMRVCLIPEFHCNVPTGMGKKICCRTTQCYPRVLRNTGVILAIFGAKIEIVKEGMVKQV